MARMPPRPRGIQNAPLPAPALSSGDRVLLAFGAEGGPVNPYHVKVHPPGVDQVPTELARHSGRLGQRLLERGFTPLPSSRPGIAPGVFPFSSSPILSRHCGSFLYKKAFFFVVFYHR